MASPEYTTSYILRFAAYVCVVCSVFVAGSAVLLKPRQEANKILDRQKKVLVVAGLMQEGEEIADAEVAKRFEASIEAKIIDLKTGAYNTEINADTFDQRRAAKDPERSVEAPDNAAKVFRLPHHASVYHVVVSGEVQKVILPIQGYGLWSTLYGYLAMDKDGQTVRGITFYEHGETPGLGGEVDNPRWKARWDGRKVYGPQGEVKISVLKGQAGSVDDDPYHVDGLSGATITSRGVSNLLDFWLGKDGFGPFLTQFRGAS